MYHPLTDLPTKVVPDCNVLLDAAFVIGGSAHKSIQYLSAMEYSILIDEMIMVEAIKILGNLTNKLNLTFSPISYFNQFLCSIPKIFVPPASPVLGKGVNHADQHVAAAARHYGAWILTGDSPLIVEVEKIGLCARFPWDVILEFSAQKGTLATLSNVVRAVPPSREHGLIFGRLLPGGWGGIKGAGQFTVCDIENIGRIYYDSNTESWVFRVVTGVEAHLKHPLHGKNPIVVCGSYNLPGIGQRGKVTILSGYFPSTIYKSTSYTMTALKCHEVGRIAIGHTIDKNHHWSGHLRALVIGPQTMNQDTWKALVATREGAPNPYDADALRHALTLIEHHYALYKEIPVLSLDGL